MSFSGRCEPEFLQEALEKVKDTSSASERADNEEGKHAVRALKQRFRFGMSLLRRERKWTGFAKTLSDDHKQILKETKDGSLKRKLNNAVFALGRGRLRGEIEGDYGDIGCARGVVRRLLDGEMAAPDTSRFSR